jgi:indole-3-glycerol phosphate synthase
MAVAAGAKVIGVNNRNLKDFTVDFENAARLRDRIPAGCIYVAESGVKTPEDVQRLEKIGADAALIGETLMRAEDPAAKLRELKQDKERTGERSQNDED